MRYVLLVQCEKVSAFAVGRSAFNAPVVFTVGLQGKQQLSQYLAERHGSLFTIVLDSKDEEHHQELIPALKRSDQQKVIDRLMQQYFPSRALCAVTIQNGKLAGAGGPRQSVTVSGIASPNDCDHWLALIKKASTLVTEIYSLSLLGALLPKPVVSRLNLCAVQMDTNDFRLMAFEGERLLISRHVTLSGDPVSDLDAHLSQTLSYVESISKPPVSNSNLTVGELSPATAPGSSEEQGTDVLVIADLPEESFVQKNISVRKWDQFAEILGKHSGGEPTNAGGLFALLAIQKARRVASLSMGHYRLSFLSRRLKHLLIAGSVCCFGVTVAAAATNAYYSEAYDSLSEFTLHLNANNLEPLMPGLGFGEPEYPIDAVRESMRLAREIEAETQFTPLHFLSALAADLTVYPELQVTGVRWGRSDFDQPGAYSKDAMTNEQLLPGGLRTRYSATVEGYVRASESEILSLSGRFNSFIATLKATDRYTAVTVVESPFGMNSDLFTSDQALPDEKQRFLIELTNQDTAR